MNLRRTASALGASAVLALSLTACGGGASGAPEDASTEDFCNAFAQLLETDPEASAADQADAIRGVGEELEEVGTPEGISDEERDGFVAFVDALKNVDEDDIPNLADSENPEDIGIDESDADAAEAFADYAGEQCTEQLLGDLPTDLPTDELPSDLPTDEES